MMWCQRATAALCRAAMFGMRLITSISSPQRCTNSHTSSRKPASFICRNCRLNKGMPATSGKSKVFGVNKCSWWWFYTCWPQFLTCRGQTGGGQKLFSFYDWITRLFHGKQVDEFCLPLNLLPCEKFFMFLSSKPKPSIVLLPRIAFKRSHCWTLKMNIKSRWLCISWTQEQHILVHSRTFDLVINF